MIDFPNPGDVLVVSWGDFYLVLRTHTQEEGERPFVTDHRQVDVLNVRGRRVNVLTWRFLKVNVDHVVKFKVGR